MITMRLSSCLLFLLLLLLPSASLQAQKAGSAPTVVRHGGILIEGEPAWLFTLDNGCGMSATVTNYAAALTDVLVPDRQGNPGHVVLGFDSLASYLGRNPKLGATVGRFANRIRNAEFTLGGQTWQLERNSKQHSIHGGTKGFYRQLFRVDTCYTSQDTAAVVFSYHSPHLEGGFPGNLDLTVAYKLTARYEIVIEYRAVTDRPTVLNLTNHSYFNLGGCRAPVTGHLFRIEADSITATDAEGIPTGELLPVAGTVYDYTTPQSAAGRMAAVGKGYDVNYQLRPVSALSSCPSQPEGVAASLPLRLAATVSDPLSGRVLHAYTTEPGMQFYLPAANLDYLVGHGGNRYGSCYAFCLEMQHFPDSPHHPHFPSTVLMPGEVYRQTTVYRFGTLPQ